MKHKTMSKSKPPIRFMHHQRWSDALFMHYPVDAEQLQRLHGDCAATFLMGCSSGALRQHGGLAPSGTPLHYLHARCPALVANLWDVTDGEIDRLCDHLLDRCAGEGGASATQTYATARRVASIRSIECGGAIIDLRRTLRMHTTDDRINHARHYVVVSLHEKRLPSWSASSWKKKLDAPRKKKGHRATRLLPGDATASGFAPSDLDLALRGVVSGVFATDDRGVVVALLPPTLIAAPQHAQSPRAGSRPAARRARASTWDASAASARSARASTP